MARYAGVDRETRRKWQRDRGKSWKRNPNRPVRQRRKKTAPKS